MSNSSQPKFSAIAMSNFSPLTIPPFPPLMTQYTQSQVVTQANDETAHDFYVRHKNNKALLLCMAVGLTDEEDKPLADWVTDNRFVNYKGKKIGYLRRRHLRQKGLIERNSPEKLKPGRRA